MAKVLDQVFEIRRRWKYKGEWREEVRYGITSLPATIAAPPHLLKFKRGHWTIENCLHYVKDGTQGEDRSTVHKDNGPKIMAALRNTAVSQAKPLLVFLPSLLACAITLAIPKMLMAGPVPLSFLERISPAPYHK